jgi:Acetyltransferase (GNAT) family.
MSAGDVALAVEWAAQEGWNPGLHDAECFRAADPRGFFIGEWRGEPVACLSAVAYGEDFGFIGLYIVKPAFRGRGFGMRVWQHGMDYLRNRNVGLDGVVAQQANYRKVRISAGLSQHPLSGRRARHRSGRALRRLAACLGAALRVAERLRSTMLSPARERFLAAWLAQPGVMTRVAVRNGQVAGYGVLRRCLTGYKIGPLFADSNEIAARLFSALTSSIAGEVFFFDVPEINAHAIALAVRHGMTSVFETARMYTREQPAISIERVFGATSFELG